MRLGEGGVKEAGLGRSEGGWVREECGGLG